MAQPTAYEKNNLPLEIRVKYCDVIEKYQQIVQYELGNITKNELIQILSK